MNNTLKNRYPFKDDRIDIKTAKLLKETKLPINTNSSYVLVLDNDNEVIEPDKDVRMMYLVSDKRYIQENPQSFPLLSIHETNCLLFDCYKVWTEARLMGKGLFSAVVVDNNHYIQYESDDVFMDPADAYNHGFVYILNTKK